MERKDFEAELTRLNHRIEQLSAKIDKNISSLRKELRKQICVVHLTQIRDLTLSLLMPGTFKDYRKPYDDIIKVTNKYFEILNRASEDEFEKSLSNLKEEINVITRLARFGEMWETPKD